MFSCSGRTKHPINLENAPLLKEPFLIKRNHNFKASHQHKNLQQVASTETLSSNIKTGYKAREVTNCNYM